MEDVMYEAITEGVRITVQSHFLADRSEPALGRWFFAYTVSIANEGERPVTLRSRHWVITDGRGETEEVRGPGVVGEQPLLEPGERFVYTSGCPLGTSMGQMRGTYQMERDDGTTFDAEVPAFALFDPDDVN